MAEVSEAEATSVVVIRWCMGGGHFAGGPHFAGGHVGGGRFGGPMGGPHIAAGPRHGGPGWNAGRAAWHSNWHGNNLHGHDHDHFVHDHNHFRNRFVAVGVGGWWPGYYGYGTATAGVRGFITKRFIPAAPIGGIGITPAPITTDGYA